MLGPIGIAAGSVFIDPPAYEDRTPWRDQKGHAFHNLREFCLAVFLIARIVPEPQRKQVPTFMVPEPANSNNLEGDE